MPVVSQGSLKPAYFAALEKLLKTETDLSWASLSWSKIKFELDLETKIEALKIVHEINVQLIDTEQAWYLVRPGRYERYECPHKDLLISMFNDDYGRIKAFGDPETFGLEQIKTKYSNKDPKKVIEVVNWCRHFIAGKDGVFIALNADVTVGGTITHGDKIDSTTTNAGASNMPPAHAAAMNRVKNMPKPTPPKPPNVPSGAGKTINAQEIVGRSNQGKRKGSGGVNIGSDGVPRDGKGNPIDLD